MSGWAVKKIPPSLFPQAPTLNIFTQKSLTDWYSKDLSTERAASK